MKRLWTLAAVLLAVSACGAQADESVETTAPVTAVTTTVASTTTTAPTTTVADAVPDELAGSWTTEISGDQVTLQLNRNFYSIERAGNTGSGKASVTGDLITFSDGNLCSGTGTYIWMVEGDTLTLTPEGPEMCPGRASAIKDKTYIRA